jgi:hypothetical protein
VAIHLEFFVDCRSRQPSFAMANKECSLEAPTAVLRLPPTGRKQGSFLEGAFDKLRAPSLSRGWIVAPSFLGLAMTSQGVKSAR